MRCSTWSCIGGDRHCRFASRYRVIEFESDCCPVVQNAPRVLKDVPIDRILDMLELIAVGRAPGVTLTQNAVVSMRSCPSIVMVMRIEHHRSATPIHLRVTSTLRAPTTGTGMTISMRRRTHAGWPTSSTANPQNRASVQIRLVGPRSRSVGGFPRFHEPIGDHRVRSQRGPEAE